MRSALPALPPSMPQFRPNRWRRLCAWLLRRCGWRLAGEFPDRAKLVLIAAPHSSWWDGVWGLLFRSALGADVSFMAKRELFAGPLGWVLRRFGGIPIERDSAHGVVQQMTARFAEQRAPVARHHAGRDAQARAEVEKWLLAHRARGAACRSCRCISIIRRGRSASVRCSSPAPISMPMSRACARSMRRGAASIADTLSEACSCRVLAKREPVRTDFTQRSA